MSYRRKLELLRQIEDEASHESVPTWAEEPILAAVRELRTIIDQAGSEPDDRAARILALANEQHAEDGKIEFDQGAEISEGNDNGAYVGAWVWVDFADTDLDKGQEDDD